MANNRWRQALRAWRQGVEALPVRAFWGLSGWLGPERGGQFGGWLFARFGPWSDRQSIILANLKAAFPTLDRRATAKLAGEIWRNAGIVMAEYPHLSAIADPKGGRIEVVLHSAFRPDRPSVFAGPHLASWEVPALGPIRNGIKMTAVYAPMANPRIDYWLHRWRQAIGATLVPRDGSLRVLLRELRQGGSIGLVMDGRTGGGVPVDFFGMQRSVSPGPAYLALKSGAQLTTMTVERLGPARYRLTIDAPIEADMSLANDQERIVAMMCEVNRRFEAYVRAQPGRWFCMKRAWPKWSMAAAAHAPEVADRLSGAPPSIPA
ncbi:Lauroyl/myristoyl acyltransferase [Arboricoccus pini]|uniref:Lauroyl/myristoyl acyltransferase n=1 Tax=Arboricoccus pini TaxID=1963835 RepID=A0A212S4J7_9PROT|nr:hypothetical protein [Arboricoccus pini]SNB80086.1 Lauroyl/myristoyl acyltransferase [Arboricoccus pini]